MSELDFGPAGRGQLARKYISVADKITGAPTQLTEEDLDDLRIEEVREWVRKLAEQKRLRPL